MLTYAEYIHNNPLPVCNTMIPAPSKPVELNAKAVAKATRTIRETGETDHHYTLAAQARALHQFAALKGRGMLTAVEIGSLLSISRRGATLSAERLVLSGHVLMTKRENQSPLYELADGATGIRTVEQKVKRPAVIDRFLWMKDQGWLKYSEIVERTGIHITHVRARMTELAKLGMVVKAKVEKKNGGFFVECRWIG